MSISKISNEVLASQGSKKASFHQAQQDFNALFHAMTNNDIPGARQAYASIQQLQSPQANSAQTTSAQTTPLAAVNSDWTSLGQALQSGNLSSAQQAFSQLGQDALAVQQARHQRVMASASALKNDIQSIGQALKSGDTTSAQKLLAQLEQNLQTSRLAFSSQPTAVTATPASGDSSGATAA